MNLGQKIRLLCRLRSLISLYLKCSCQRWRSYRYRSRYYFCNFRHRKRPLLVQWTKSDLCKFFCMKFWSSGPVLVWGPLVNLTKGSFELFFFITLQFHYKFVFCLFCIVSYRGLKQGNRIIDISFACHNNCSETNYIIHIFIFKIRLLKKS